MKPKLSKIISISLGLLMVVSLLVSPGQSAMAAGSVSLDTIETPYTENFDSLGWGGGGPFSSTPNGWYFLEIGRNADTNYSASDGSNVTGDTYSYGLDADRAFGGLRDTRLATFIGVSFTNNVGYPINSVTITYTGEQWRLGDVGGADKLDFQYSTDAVSIDSGTWTDVNALDFTAPVTTGTIGALNGNLAANRTQLTAVITGLNIPNGQTFWIHWLDFDTEPEDDGLAVDDFSITAHSNEMPPTVTGTVPANGATAVAVDANVTVNFSEPVDLGASWFSINCSISGVHTAAVSGGPTSYTINPDVNFSYGDACTGTVYASQVSDQDTDDPPDNMLSNYAWSFSIVNDIPAAIGQSVATNEDTSIPITLSAIDYFPGTLTWHYSSPGQGSLSGVAPDLTYTPDADFNGSDSFTFYVNDGYVNSNTATIDITVNPVNDPPVLAAIGDKTIDEGSQLSFTATATDVELATETLTFTLSGTPPTGAAIDPSSGGFAWTPSEAQGPGSYPVTVQVCDDGTPVECDSETITLTVDEVNLAPVLGVIGSQSVVELTLLTFTATAADADLPANTLTFSLVGEPVGAAINPSSGSFAWTPTEAQVGEHTFTVKVCDDAAVPLCDEEQITVTVFDTLAITSLDLRQSTDKTIWKDVYGSLGGGYWMGLNSALEFEYLDVKNLTANRTLGDGLHPFYLDTTSLPAGYYEYWALKSVESGASGWQGWMYQIITGSQPMFYLKVSGSSYKLIDGLSWDYFTTEEFLRISGDYPLGAYTFDGTVTSDFGDSAPVTATMTFEAVPHITSLTLKQSLDKAIWTDVFGSFASYAMDLNGDPAAFAYLDVDILISNKPLKIGLHPFYLGTVSLPAGYYDYWDARDVNSLAAEGTWQAWMYQIITGNEPMFYLKVSAGSDYKLVDGLSLDYFANEEYLRVSGDYPLGSYTFNGIIEDQILETSLVTAHISFEALPKIESLSLAESADKITWTPLAGNLAGGYEMALDLTQSFQYIDVGALTANKALAEGLHPFYLNPTSLPAGYYDYWDAKGVNSSAVPDTWQAWMYQIITGNEPMFYLMVSAGPDYKLVDGLSLDYFVNEEYLRVSGDYPLGAYSFDGTITDQIGESSPVTAAITFVRLNHAPVAAGQAVSTPEDTPVGVTLTAIDVEDDPLIWDIVSLPAHGGLTGAAPDLIYTPDVNFYGSDSFTFKVNDGLLDSNTAEVTISVTAVNDAPVLDLISYKTVDEGVELAFTASATDVDLPAETLTYTLEGTPPAGAQISTGGAFTWTPSEAQGPYDSYSITVKVCDDGTPVECDSQAFSVTVYEVNVAPVLAATGDKTVDEGHLLTFTASATDADLPANILTFSFEGTPPPGADISTAGVFSWTPTEEQGPGSYPITIKVCDDGSPILCDSEGITITVNELSSEADILTFTIPGGITVIDQVAKTITVSMPYGTDLTSLTPTITVSDKAAVDPASGAAQDFSAPVIYTVTAEDGTTQEYTVTVVKPLFLYLYLPVISK